MTTVPSPRSRSRLPHVALTLLLVMGIAGCAAEEPAADSTADQPPPEEPTLEEPASADDSAEDADDTEPTPLEEEADEPQEIIDVVVPATAYNVNTGYFPTAVADALGFFEAEGIRPEFVATGGGGEAVRAFTADGNAQLASVGLPAAVPAVDAGETFRIFGQLSVASDTWIAVRAGEGIEDVEGLEGRTIGVTRPGATTEQVAVAALESVGLAADDAELVYLGGVPDLVVALQEGLVDAISGAGWLTRTQYVDVEGTWTLLGTGDEFTPLVDAVWVAKDDVIAEQPHIYEAFMRARNTAVDYIADNPDDPGLRDIMKDWLGITDPAMDEIVDIAVERLAADVHGIYGDGTSNLETYDGVAAVLVEQDIFTEVPEDWSVYVVG